MVLLCFVLDLRTVSPPLLRDLKQSLLQLANFYAISAPANERSLSKPLRDRIGLCCVLKNRISCSNELKVAYSPRGNFDLRDFHHAVNNLPVDAFSPEFNNSGVISCDDAPVLCTLVKRWLKELKDETEDPHVRFIFRNNLLGSLNQIFCSLCTSFNHIIDEFIPTQTCRCHGISLDEKNGNKIKKPCSCPITGNDLGTLDIIENTVKVGAQTILFMPSFHQSVKLQKATSPIDFKVIERTKLGSLSEGAIFGTSYFVTPSSSNDSDDIDKSELNNRLFQGLCRTLQSLDEGLVCSSNSNLETLGETSFQCFYILLPSDKGLMLLRRLVGLEEIMPLPDISQLTESTAADDEINNSVLASLLQMEVRDYNPVLHERGFHQKLNLLVNESLQFGSFPPKSTQGDSTQETIPSTQAVNVLVLKEEIPPLDLKSGQDKITARITEEWEQLIVDELPKIGSPTCIPKPKLDPLVFSSPETNKQLDEKTSRILERLEVPRQLKTRVVSPIILSQIAPIDVCVTKKPLIPFGSTHVSDQGTIASQPMKPNFQRLKRKQR